MSSLLYTSRNNILIDLAIEDRVTFIKGNSGTGKTFLINIIKSAIANKAFTKECNVDISRFVVVDDNLNIENINNVKEKSIVFIDRYDSYSKENKKRIWEKMKSVSAAWIIMTRHADFPTSVINGTFGFKELKYSKDDNGILLSFNI